MYIYTQKIYIHNTYTYIYIYCDIISVSLTCAFVHGEGLRDVPGDSLPRQEGRLFLDRDPDLFEWVLRFARTGTSLWVWPWESGLCLGKCVRPWNPEE